MRGPVEKVKTSIRYCTSVLRDAEQELEAATGRRTLNAADRKLMRATAELKRLQVGTQPNPV